MRSQRLLKSARDNLAAADPNDLTDHNIRQASIDAYRAMFHTLSETIVASLYPQTAADPDGAVHESAYRALNHSIWQIGRSRDFQSLFNSDIRRFMTIGEELKKKREIADYTSHRVHPSRINALQDVEDAHTAIDIFNNAPQSHKQLLALYLLSKSR